VNVITVKASDIPQITDAVHLMKYLGAKATRGKHFLFVAGSDWRRE
jgi:NCAIR mutase (PurE)-related protein